MNFLDTLFPMIATFFAQSFIILIWIVGIAISITRRKEHYRKSLLATTSFIILIITNLATLFLQSLLPVMLEIRQLGLAFMVMGGIASIFNSIAWIILLMALFGKKDQAGQKDPQPLL